jgi:hypothetical protein
MTSEESCNYMCDICGSTSTEQGTLSDYIVFRAKHNHGERGVCTSAW